MFELVKGTQAASLYIAKEADDFAGLSHVAEKIQKDIELVTGVAPKICDAMPEGYSIIPGTIGKNPVIDEMIANGKLNVSQLDGKRESYALCLVDAHGSGIGRDDLWVRTIVWLVRLGAFALPADRIFF